MCTCGADKTSLNPYAHIYLNYILLTLGACAPREVKNRHFGFLSYSYSSVDLPR